MSVVKGRGGLTFEKETTILLWSRSYWIGTGNHRGGKGETVHWLTRIHLWILYCVFHPHFRSPISTHLLTRPSINLSFRFSDFSSDLHESTSSSELRRRHSMLPSSITIPERKSSNPRKQRTIYAGGQTKVSNINIWVWDDAFSWLIFDLW